MEVLVKSESLEDVVAIIGLGNIGLPLALAFGERYNTIGFDLDAERVNALQQGLDNRTSTAFRLKTHNRLTFSYDVQQLTNCTIFIIAVPTSTNYDGTPNLSALKSASYMVASCLKVGDLVIYESTVYPGCTETICVPILEQFSSLIYNTDFFVGYSPERINTADNQHTLSNTIKITAGSNKQTAQRVDELYKSIVEVGTYSVSSIQIAEAAKLVENAQRDVNIAFMNEVSAILTINNIRFEEMWNACCTKWNFLPFKPGLVGGECLPLASNYLRFLARQKEGLLSCTRNINDNLPLVITQTIEEKLKTQFPELESPKILILGVTYKPNSSTIKGSIVPVLFTFLNSKGLSVECYDPLVVDANISMIEIITSDKKYHLIIKAINHDIFEYLDFSTIVYENCLVFDVQNFSFDTI